MVVPDDIRGNPRNPYRPDADFVSTEAELLERISNQRNLIGLAQMSASVAPRLEIDSMKWSRTVSLIIGNSFADRVIFWNVQHLMPVYLGGGITSLKASLEDVHDPERLKLIVNILKNRIYVPLGGNTSHSHVVIRSASIASEQLEDIAQQLKQLHSFNAYTSETLESVDVLVPSREALEHARRHVEPVNTFDPQDWHEFAISENSVRPPKIEPRHIRGATQLPGSAKQGLWALDIDIERAVNHSWAQNVQHRWRLPRRLRMVGAFTRGYQLGGFSPICMPRSTGDGLVALMGDVEGTLPELRVPSDEIAFRYALCGHKDWWPFRQPQEAPMRSNPRYVRFDTLTKQFDKLRNAFWERHRPGAPREEWDQDEKLSLPASVKYLCQREIIHQGHEWRCQQCFNNNWVSIDDLKNTLVCEVCGGTQSAPVTDPWHFRLSGFVLEGLRDHGLLPLIWYLAKCARLANVSFFFLEPQEMFFTEASVGNNKPDTECDLLIVADGITHLCEAKSSGQNIDIPKLVEQARRIRPDIVTLAIMEPESIALRNRLDELRQQLVGTGIDAELITLEDQDIDQSPRLPAGNSFWTRVL